MCWPVARYRHRNAVSPYPMPFGDAFVHRSARNRLRVGFGNYKQAPPLMSWTSVFGPNLGRKVGVAPKASASGACGARITPAPAGWRLERVNRFEQCTLQSPALDRGPPLGRCKGCPSLPTRACPRVMVVPNPSLPALPSLLYAGAGSGVTKTGISQFPFCGLSITSPTSAAVLCPRLQPS